MRFIKAFFYNIYLDFVSFLRIKIAVFFTVIFPLMLFIIFSNIWGVGNKNYVIFILTGIICLMSISEGLFSIGPVIKDYYSSGMVKYLKHMPIDISFFFLTFIISRFLFFQFIILLLVLIAHFGFGANGFIIYDKIFIGSIFGFFLFSFLGLCISFFGKKDSGRTLSNIVYFMLIFTSDIFYSISGSSSFIQTINSFLPVNDIVNLMRGEDYRLYVILSWTIALFLVFRILFKNIKSNRI